MSVVRDAHETAPGQVAWDSEAALHGAVVNDGYTPLYIRPNSQNDQSDPSVNRALWVILLCPCRFSNCNAGGLPGGDVDRSGGGACGGAGGPWEISVPSSQFCSELKTAL